MRAPVRLAERMGPVLVFIANCAPSGPIDSVATQLPSVLSSGCTASQYFFLSITLASAAGGCVCIGAGAPAMSGSSGRRGMLSVSASSGFVNLSIHNYTSKHCTALRRFCPSRFPLRPLTAHLSPRV